MLSFVFVSSPPGNITHARYFYQERGNSHIVESADLFAHECTASDVTGESFIVVFGVRLQNCLPFAVKNIGLVLHRIVFDTDILQQVLCGIKFSYDEL